jgi:hypothetical protein
MSSYCEHILCDGKFLLQLKMENTKVIKTEKKKDTDRG